MTREVEPHEGCIHSHHPSLLPSICSLGTNIYNGELYEYVSQTFLLFLISSSVGGLEGGLPLLAFTLTVLLPTPASLQLCNCDGYSRYGEGSQADDELPK